MSFIQTNGINQFYTEIGEGPPLLLIMGITAPGLVWEKHAVFWKDHFRCILGDNRGVGFSDKPAGPYSSEQMADDYAGLLDAMQISEAHVVGCSMGSTIAQQLALRHPNKVKSLVLMCPWARCDRMATAIFQHMMTIKARLRPEEFIHYIQWLIYGKSSWDNDSLYQEMLEGRQGTAIDAVPQPLHALEAQAEACMSHNTLLQLHQITQRCLVIGGQDDIFTPAWMAREVAAAISDSELFLYENAGHAFHWEKISDFNPRVNYWLLESERLMSKT
ncbi:MAG: alpha/beta hydrolase [Chitinophagaceae bacterium]